MFTHLHVFRRVPAVAAGTLRSTGQVPHTGTLLPGAPGPPVGTTAPAPGGASSPIIFSYCSMWLFIYCFYLTYDIINLEIFFPNSCSSLLPVDFQFVVICHQSGPPVVIHKQSYQCMAACVSSLSLTEPNEAMNVVQRFLADISSLHTTPTLQAFSLLAIGEIGKHVSV